MEKGTKKVLTIVGVVALVVVGYKFLTKKEEEETTSGFWGWSPKKRKVVLNAPVNRTLGNHCDCDTGLQYTTTASGSSWTGKKCTCNNSAV